MKNNSPKRNSSKRNNAVTIEDLRQEIYDFRQQQKTLQLASCAMNNEPLASYAPFVEDEEANFYLLLSGLASHSANLHKHQAEQSRVSVLLIEDEKTARNVFARKRLTYQCEVSVWPREHPQWQFIIERLQKKLGKTIAVLAALGDFNLYCLTPKQGNYVRGFGQAYELRDAEVPVIET